MTRREGDPGEAGATRAERARTRAESGGTRAESGGTRAESGGTRAESGGTRAESGIEAGRFRRVRLPEPLEARFDHLYDLDEAGAQADIAICRDRETGVEVAIKLYRIRAEQIDVEAIARLRDTDPDHVVPIIEFETWGGWTWEVQEFFPLGSLAALLQAPGRVDQEMAAEILQELAGALVYLHERDIVHRDLKPQNVLLRSLTPLDCVLADFGLATNLDLSMDIRSIAGTFPYLPPEAHGGIVSRAGDWWALGMIMYEALHGHHLFASAEDGRMLPDNQVRAMVSQGTFSLESLDDGRWDLLLRGLLVHDHTHRWSGEEVAAWRAGETPEVHAGPVAPQRHAVRPFAFGGADHADPAALGGALRSQWAAAGDLLAGRGVEELRVWLRQTEVGADADHVLTGGLHPDPAVVRLQVILDPDTPPRFRGRELTAASLNEVLRAGQAGDVEANDWLTRLRGGRILSAWSAETDTAEAVRAADGLLDTWWRDAESALDRVPSSGPGGIPTEERAQTRASLEAVLLVAALDAEQRPPLLARARQAAAASPLPAWAETIAALARASDPSPGVAAVAAAVLPSAARLESARVEAEDLARRERERAERQRRRSEAAATARRRARSSWRRWLLPYVVVGAAGTLLESAALDSLLVGVLLGLLSSGAVAAWHLVLPQPRAQVGNAVPVLVFLWMVVSAVAELGNSWPFANDMALAVPFVTAMAVWIGNGVSLLADRVFTGDRRPRRSDDRWVSLGRALSFLSAAAIAPVVFLEIQQTLGAGGIGEGYASIAESASWYLTGLQHAVSATRPVTDLLHPLAGLLALLASACAVVLLVGERDVPIEHERELRIAWGVTGLLAVLAVVANIFEVGVVLFFIGFVGAALLVAFAMLALGIAVIANM